jgi:hypothetical protein
MSLGRLQTPTDGPCDWRLKNLSQNSPVPPPLIAERWRACLQERLRWGAKTSGSENFAPLEFTEAPPGSPRGASSFLAPVRAVVFLPGSSHRPLPCRVAHLGSHCRRPRSDRCAKRDALRTERAWRVGWRS